VPYLFAGDRSVGLLAGAGLFVVSWPRLKVLLRRRPGPVTGRPLPDILVATALGVLAGAAVSLLLALTPMIRPSELLGMGLALLVTAPVSYGLIYHAIRRNQENHPETAARRDASIRAALNRSLSMRQRHRLSATSTREKRATLIAIYAALYSLATIVWAISEDDRFRFAQAAFIGLIAGLALGVLVESATALFSTPRHPHPLAAFADFVGPRVVLWTAGVVLYAGSLVLLFAGASRTAALVRSPVAEIGAGLFFGLFGGQLAVRLLLITPPGHWALGALGRVFLAYTGELPWRLRMFLRYAARINLVHVNPNGGFEFRHQLFLEYLSGRTTEPSGTVSDYLGKRA
jgi:hypothetical protein